MQKYFAALSYGPPKNEEILEDENPFQQRRRRRILHISSVKC